MMQASHGALRNMACGGRFEMSRRLDAVIRRGYAGIPLRDSTQSLNQGGTAKWFVSPLTK